MKITNLETFKQSLEELGYENTGSDNCVIIKLNGISVVCIIVENNLTITCRICDLDLFTEEELGILALKLLQTNSSIVPFAFSIIPDEDVVEKSSIVLIDSVTLTDLVSEEIDDIIISLKSALITAKTILS